MTHDAGSDEQTRKHRAHEVRQQLLDAVLDCIEQQRRSGALDPIQELVYSAVSDKNQAAALSLLAVVQIISQDRCLP